MCWKYICWGLYYYSRGLSICMNSGRGGGQESLIYYMDLVYIHEVFISCMSCMPKINFGGTYNVSGENE